jgi:tetratricopeptide (TPR) repeat protein
MLRHPPFVVCGHRARPQGRNAVQDQDWQERVDAVWADASLSEDAVVAAIDALADERPADHPVALFERAGARDSAGREAEAEVLYRRALAIGLDDGRRTRATIQLASTIRNLGQTDEALALLRAEYEREPRGELHDAAAAFYALALVSAGEAVTAASVALEALAPHLPRYTRSVRGYAAELREPPA